MSGHSLSPRLFRLIALTAAVFVLGVSIYFTFFAPRPYAVTRNDAESDYYTNAKLIARGLPVAIVLHPGIPAYAVLGQVMRMVGDTVDRAPIFFASAYIVIALFAVAALLYALEKVFRDQPWGLAVLSLGTLVAIPPFLTYLNYLSSDSFIFAFSLPLLAGFWHGLRHDFLQKPRWFIPLVLGVGLLAALKSTLFLITVPLVAAWLVYLLLRSRSYRIVVRNILFFFLSLLASFLFFILPAWQQFPRLVRYIVTRRDFLDARPWKILINGIRNLGDLWLASPLLVTLSAVILGSFLFIAIKRAGKMRQEFRSAEGAFFLAATIFLFLGAVFFVYGLSLARVGEIKPLVWVSGNAQYDLGIVIRYVFPSFLLLPFFLDYIYRFSPWQRKKIDSWQSGLALLGIFLALSSVVSYAVFRERFLAFKLDQISSTQRELTKEIEAAGIGGGRIAIWEAPLEPPEALFHLWGNHQYGYNMFDQEIGSGFPAFTLFHPRVVERILWARPETGPPTRLQKISRWWKVKIPEPYRNTLAVFTDSSGGYPSVIAFPEAEREIGRDKEDAVLTFLSRHTGKKFFARQIFLSTGEWTFYLSP